MYISYKVFMSNEPTYSSHRKFTKKVFCRINCFGKINILLAVQNNMVFFGIFFYKVFETNFNFRYQRVKYEKK